MIYSIEAPRDGGNIRVHSIAGAEAMLSIRPDGHAAWAQWFHMRVTADPGARCILRIVNAGDCTYPEGWIGYRACVSDDGAWKRTHTEFDGTVMTIRHTMESSQASFAYFEPYSLFRHHEQLQAARRHWPVDRLGRSVEGRGIDRIRIGNGPFQIWLIGRQHSGETMASWWMEGALERLAATEGLLARATINLVPLVNPDGAYRGNLRANAAGIDLNRQWRAPDPSVAPEVACILRAMAATGVDFLLDVHGDETIPHIFIDGCESIPAPTDYQLNGLNEFKRLLLARSEAFQTQVGYPTTYAGEAAAGMAARAVAARFGAIGMTLEMPFANSLEAPDEDCGWSANASMILGRQCVDALQDFISSHC